MTTATAPATAAAGYFALLSSIVTNHRSSWPLSSFTDTVPAGPTISSVAAGSGTCTTSGPAKAAKKHKGQPRRG